MERRPDGRRRMMSLSARWSALRAPALGRMRRLLILAFLGAALAIAGGASRFDEDQQAIVRLAAVLALGASFWSLDFKPLTERPALMLGAAAAYLLVLCQLIPLPPQLWEALPGHDLYAAIAMQVGAVGWRPLSLTPDLTLNALYALLPATAAAVAALYLDGRQRIWLARGVVAIACASAVVGLSQVTGGESGLRLYRVTSEDAPVGLLANRNHQAAFLSCALALTGALIGLRRRDVSDPRIGLAAGLGVAALLALAVLSTGSRMGLLLVCLGALGGLWAYKASGRRLLPRRPVLRLVLAVGTLALLAGVMLAAVRSGAVDRLAHTNRVSETRAAMVEPLLTTARAFMPLGSGFGSFETVFRRFEPDSLLSTIYMNQAHNEPLQLAIEGGVPALVLLAGFILWWGRTSMRILGRGVRALSVAWVASTVILMASSLVDYPLRTPLLSSLFAVACVEMARAAKRSSELRREA
jgi:O-antigen ligase